MKSLVRGLVGLTVALLALPAFGQSLKGKVPPKTPLRKAWNGAGERSLADFEGKVILLECFATW